MASVHHRRRNVSDTHGAGEGGCLGPGGSHESPDSERGERYVYDRTCVCGSLERDCRFTLGRKPQCRKSGKTKGYEEHGIKRYSKGITGICWKPGGVSAHPRYVYYLPESQRGLSTSNTSLYISSPPPILRHTCPPVFWETKQFSFPPSPPDFSQFRTPTEILV